jgi:hypothetical protein
MVKFTIFEHIGLLNFIPSRGSALLINSVFPPNYFDVTDRADSISSIKESGYDFIFVGGVFSTIYDLKGAFTELAARLSKRGLLIVKDAVTGREGAYFNTILNIADSSFVRANRPEEIISAAEAAFYLKEFSIKSELRNYLIEKDSEIEKTLLKALADTPEDIIKERGITYTENTLSLSIPFGVFLWEKA